MNYTLLKLEMTRKLILSFIFFLSFSGLIFGSQAALEYEIVPFDYADAAMKEQLCEMVDEDQQIADLLHFTQEDSMRKYLSEPDLEFHTQLLVCRSIDEISTVYGFIMCSMHDNFIQFGSVGFVNCIAVGKMYRGRGIAQSLLQAFELMCRDNSIPQLLLFVAKDNDKAIRAYQLNGFEIVDDSRENDEIPMIKFLK